MRSLIVLVAVLAQGCGRSAEPAGVIDRETFITTWMELRRAAIRTRDPLPASERTRVLDERGVTEDQMLEFADAHGGDPSYMAEVWTEVELRMRPAPATDSTVQP